MNVSISSIIAFIALLNLLNAVVHNSSSDCESLWTPHREFNISSGKFVRLNVRRNAYYDHESCFVMKSRYNCAHANTSAESVLDWKFFLRTPAGRLCEPESMVEKSGGISNLAKHIRTWSHRNGTVSHTNIFLSGDSFVRQVWESIVCRFRDRIKGGFVSVGGSEVTNEAWDSSAFTADDMGELVPLFSMRGGCHSRNHEHFYEPGVPMPTVAHANCSDDIAMVELDEGLRIYYTFRFSAFDTDLPKVLQRMQLNPADLDVIVSNLSPSKYEKLSSLAPGVPVLRIGGLLPFLHKVMLRDTHRWFGADNVGMIQSPDTHPCMPGVPDDEVNILLFALTHRLFDIAVL